MCSSVNPEEAYNILTEYLPYAKKDALEYHRTIHLKGN
jgi:hypothetical protein